MKVIRLSASFIFVATVIIVVSALAHSTETGASPVTSDTSTRVDSSQSNRTAVPPTKFSAAEAQRSLAPPMGAGATPINVAYAPHNDGSGAGLSGDSGPGPSSHRYAPGPTETLVFGIVLLVGGGFLRRRRRTDEA
jgi:hypothetical protein